jgi:hypothetical protein
MPIGEVEWSQRGGLPPGTATKVPDIEKKG